MSKCKQYSDVGYNTYCQLFDSFVTLVGLPVRDAPFDIWGGGGGLEKKFVEKLGWKKKFVVEIDEKYVDQKNHQMLTYIIGKAYDKNIFHFLDET